MHIIRQDADIPLLLISCIYDKFLYQTTVNNSSFSCQLHLNDYKLVWIIHFVMCVDCIYNAAW